MISEIPVIEFLTVESQDSFGQWINLSASCTRVRATRGGRSSVPTMRIDVGELEVTMLGEINLQTTYHLRPNRPVRLVSMGQAMFTGKIDDVSQVEQVDVSKSGVTTVRTFTTITALDERSPLANTMRYGAISPAGFETITARVLRLFEGRTAPRILGVSPSYRVADTVRDTSLANQLDLACDATGSFWYIDRLGRTTVRVGPDLGGPSVPPPTMTFSDVKGTGLEYLSAERGFNSRDVINTVDMELISRTLERDEDGDYGAVSYDYRAVSEVSAAQWGTRATSMEVCLYHGPGHGLAPARRAAEIFTSRQDAQYAVSSFLWNAQENRAAIGTMDIGDRYRVIRAGIRQESFVLSLEWTITPHQALVKVGLTDHVYGISFSDWENALGDITFDELDNAVLPWDTFDEFDDYLGRL